MGQISNPVAAAIAQQEGYNTPGTLAAVNNNPGNLIASTWTQSQPGYVGTNGGFAVFATPQDGVNALDALIQNYANNGATITSMMAAWAPASQAGNNPGLYAQNVANAAGVTPGTSVAAALSGSAGTAVTDDSGDSGDLMADLSDGTSDGGVDWGTVGIIAAVAAVAVLAAG